MKKTEIQQNLKNVADNIDPESFIYDFLSSFGFSKTTITRLKKGDYNLSKKEGELFYKGKIFFKVTKSEELLHTIDELSKDEKLARQKPRFLFVTDFEKVLAVDTKLKTNKEFPLIELGDQTDFFLPLSGAEIYRVSTNNKADRDAAYKLGELYDLLVTENPDWVAKGSHHLNLFLSRLLFCFFAEDTGIFDTKSIFTEALVNNTKADGSDVDEFLDLLFLKLDSKPNEGIFPDYLQGFQYVNGGLFRDTIECPKFSKKARQMLISSGELEWADINPDIFGSMIQAVADPEERNNLGMHYTSVINIHKLIKPLFLDELYEEFEKNKDNARALDKLLVRMSKIKFFDPACGSGNFLIITYKELRLLEIQIIKHLIDLGENRLFFTEISLTQFYGIEIKDFAHEMAILSLWLAEHQMNQVFETELLDNGQSKPILPLKEAGNIVAGNAARTDWESVCPKNEGDEIYIIGNPPYLGSSMQDKIQKSDMSFVFNSFNDFKNLDYVSIWFYKAAKYIEGINAQLAFVSTNSICQGEQVALLWPKVLLSNIEIGFAYQSFKWTNNARGNAGVTVIIIGLRNKSTQLKLLFTKSIAKEVSNINSYLIDSKNIYFTRNSKPINGFPELVRGSMPTDGGNFELSTEEKDKLLNEYPLSKKFIKKYISGGDFIKGIHRYCLWIEDRDVAFARTIPLINNKLDKITEFRLESIAPTTVEYAKYPNRFRQISYKETEAIVVPLTSSDSRRYIPFGFVTSDYVVTNSAGVIYDAQPWLFGVLHSKMHMVWVDTVGGKLETRYRYSTNLCYNNFPFPTLNEKQKESITQYVFSVLDERAKFPEKTMAWLYNPETMPSGLKQAHHELDLAIERIYRLVPFNSDEERLAFLFKMYEEMTNRESLFAKEKKKKRVKK